MRRGLRGLVIVLGMLWVAAAADALTMWNGETSPELRSFLFEDYGGVWVGPSGDSGLSYRTRPPRYTDLDINPTYQPRGFVPNPRLFAPLLGRREFVPYSYSRPGTRDWIRAGGNSRFGRRDFIWHPGSVTPPNYLLPVRPLPTPPGRQGFYLPLGLPNYFRTGRPFPGLPGMRMLYHPLGGTLCGSLGGWPGLGCNDISDVPVQFFDDLGSNLLFRRRSSELSWQMLRYLVGVIPNRYDPIASFIDGWGGENRALYFDDLEIGEPGAVFRSLPGLEQGSSFGGRLEFRWDRFSFSLEDFYGASASVVVNAAPVPEPGTAALLLAGLCALAARRRRC